MTTTVRTASKTPVVKATKVTPSASKSGATSASAVTVTPGKGTLTPEEEATKGRTQRMADALKHGKGLSLAEVATTIATSETAVTAVRESEKTIADRLAGIVKDRKSKEADWNKNLRLMERLAAELNPNLVEPAPGRNAKREDVNAAVVIALGISKDAAKKRVQRWVMAGSLHIAHGVPTATAYTNACNSEVSAFWKIVTGPATATTHGPITRKPSTASNKGRATAPAKPVTVAEATKVVTEAKAAKVASMTPAQRGAELLSDFLKSYAALMDAQKDGTATLTTPQQTKVNTAIRAIMASVA